MYDIIAAQAPYFMMVFLRISAFMAFIPFFENLGIIMPIKVGFAFLVSLLLFPSMSISSWTIPNHLPGFLLVVTQEVLVGILMGLTFLILLFGLQLAGRMVGFQMAFSMANVVDPTFGTDSTVLSTMLVLLGTLLLITLGGDHYLLYSLGKSFEILVPGSIAVSKSLITALSTQIISYLSW